MRRATRHVGVFRAELVPAHLERLAQQPDRSRPVALFVQHEREVAHHERDLRIGSGPSNLRFIASDARYCLLRAAIVTLGLEHEREIVETGSELRMRVAQHLAFHLERFLVQRLGQRRAH